SRRQRVQVAVELTVVVVLAVAFLLLFQQRPGWVDAVLGLVAVGLIAAGTARGRAVWAFQPSPAEQGSRRLAAASREAALFTVPVVAAFLAAGLALGAAETGWSGALERVGNWHLAAALLLYLPWALLQQFVFQFFLLGRLLFLFPPVAAIAITALAFSGVHF